MSDFAHEVHCRVGALHVHPIKSCAGIAVSECLLVETGLELDRTWMVVDDRGEMLTQRRLPRLALIRPTLRHSDLVLRAPGMLALHLLLDSAEAATRARVWNDVVSAYDMGALAAQWFSDFLGPELHGQARLVRFDPAQRRPCDPAWAGTIASRTEFADGFPLLVTGSASLAELNQRLAAQALAPVTMARFRPNLVLDGLQSHDEDHLHELAIATDEGPVTLRLVKPCVRCDIPNVDPETATPSGQPGATLAGYRADARMNGGITFGMNAVIVEGFERTLRVGQRVQASWRFD